MKRITRPPVFWRAFREAVILLFTLTLMLVFVSGIAYAGGGDDNKDVDTLTTAVGMGDECLTDPTFYLVLDPAETRNVLINAFCMDRNRFFPGRRLVIVEDAPADVQVAIRYSVDQKYTEQMPELWSAQLAVWQLLDGYRVPHDPAQKLADEIVAYAKEHANDVPECLISESISLADAVTAGLVEASIDDFTDASPKGYHFYGSGTLVVKNLTDQVQVLNLPYGTRFEDAANGNVQNVAIFPKPGLPPDTPPPTDIPETGGLLPPEVFASLGFLFVGGVFVLIGKRMFVSR